MNNKDFLDLYCEIYNIPKQQDLNNWNDVLFLAGRLIEDIQEFLQAVYKKGLNDRAVSN